MKSDSASGNGLSETLERVLLEGIVKRSPVVSFIWDLTDRWPLAFVSENVSQFGYSRAAGEITYESIVHPDDLDRVVEEVERNLRAGSEEFVQQYRILTKDGETRWVRDWTYVLRDAHGEAKQNQCLILDITPMLDAETRARQFAQFPLQDPEPVLSIDLNGDVLLANSAAQALLASLGDCPDDQVQAWRNFSKACLASQGAVRANLNVADRIYSLRSSAAAQDDPVYIYGDDITDRVDALDRLADLLNSADAAIFQYVRTLAGTDKITYMNPGCYDIWELTPDEIGDDPAPIWAMIYEDDMPDMVQSVERSARTLSPWHHEWRIVPASGKTKWLRGSATPRRRYDGSILWNTIIVDITAVKTAAESQRHALTKTVHALAATLETRDPYTAGHQENVAKISIKIGLRLGLDANSMTGLELGATIHDIGKIAVPSEILSKPTKLSDIEFALIKEHPRTGANLLKGVNFEWPIRDMVLQHHERMDGSGYPDNLKGDAILLEARIIAVADTLDAMASHRPYRPALGLDRAVEELRRGIGIHYDPNVVNACLDLIESGEISLY